MAEYIEREAAIKRFNFVVLDCLGMEPTIRTWDIIKALESIPAADVREVKKSKWFDGACVSCGFKPMLDYEYDTVYDDHNGYRWNYCPNCGAEMREPPKEEQT